jgi:hypothetical protein
MLQVRPDAELSVIDPRDQGAGRGGSSRELLNRRRTGVARAVIQFHLAARITGDDEHHSRGRYRLRDRNACGLHQD